MSSWLRLACATLLTTAACAAHAQGAYPGQPVKVIVPFPPAGGTDVVTRLLVDKVRAATGWTFIVDNKAGAGGNIGMDAVAKSKAEATPSVMMKVVEKEEARKAAQEANA